MLGCAAAVAPRHAPCALPAAATPALLLLSLPTPTLPWPPPPAPLPRRPQNTLRALENSVAYAAGARLPERELMSVIDANSLKVQG